MNKENNTPPPLSETPPAEKTPGGVEADLMKRFLGALIDGFVISAVTSVLGQVTGSAILSIGTSAILWLIRDSLPFLNGQSVGKMVMKTKVVKADGSSLSGDWKTGAFRNALLALPLAGAIVEGIILITRKDTPQAGLRLGDEWAQTKVISVA